MMAPKALTEAERHAMNEAARKMAWDYYNKGALMVVEALRDGVADGYRPTRKELLAMCELIEKTTKLPR